jgi:hypothetical protein
MRRCVRRALREDDGTVEVHLLEFPIDAGHGLCEHYPTCKDCRIMLERIGLSTAYLRHEPLINENGFRKPHKKTRPVTLSWTEAQTADRNCRSCVPQNYRENRRRKAAIHLVTKLKQNATAGGRTLMPCCRFGTGGWAGSTSWPS